MGVIQTKEVVERVSLTRYHPEYNEDGTEKHIHCDGARFHVISWDGKGAKCSEPNCEINRDRKDK